MNFRHFNQLPVPWDLSVSVLARFCDMMHGDPKGLAPPLRWCGTLPVWANLCRFKLITANKNGQCLKQIFADQFARVWRKSSWIYTNCSRSICRFASKSSSQPSLPVRSFKSLWKYGGSGVLTGMPWIPPCLDLKCLGSLPTFKAPVSKLTYGQWV